MHLCGVNEEGVAQIDCTGVAGRLYFGPVDSHLVQPQMRHAGLAGRFEKARHVQMRAWPYSGGCVGFPTSENRNSISSARPRDVTLTRHAA